jgi:hypothetical protein
MNFHINSIESFSAHPDGHSCLASVHTSRRGDLIPWDTESAPLQVGTPAAPSSPFNWQHALTTSCG